MKEKKVKQNIEFSNRKGKLELIRFLLRLYEIQEEKRDDILKFRQFEDCCQTTFSKEETITFVTSFLTQYFPSLLPVLEDAFQQNMIHFYQPNETELPSSFDEENLVACLYENDQFCVYLPITETIIDGSNLIHEFMHLTNVEGETNEFYYIHEIIPFLMDQLYQAFLVTNHIGTKKERQLLSLENHYNCFYLNDMLIREDSAYCDEEATIRLISHTLALVVSSYLLETKEKEELYENILDWNEGISYQLTYEFMESLGLMMKEQNDVLVFTRDSLNLLFQCYQRRLDNIGCYQKEKKKI